jgi:fructose-specific phosphotransferase system IIA component
MIKKAGILMLLSQFINKINIIIDSKSLNKWDIIDEMLQTAEYNNQISSQDFQTIKKQIIQREKSMSTGIGYGVALPHCATNVIQELIIILCLNHKGIDFNSIDNKPVHIIYLILIPQKKLKQYIKILAKIAQLMSNSSLRKKLQNAKTPQIIINSIHDAELL